MNETHKLWLPEAASSFTKHLDPLFSGYMILALAILFGIIVTLVIFGNRFIRKSADQKASAQITHNLKLELAWTIIPSIIFFVLFVFGFIGYLDMSVAPKDAMNIEVVGQKWNWTFNYPNGASEDTLVVPVNQPVKLTMYSRDVLHSMYIPAFRVKKDVVPNMYSTLWFSANKKGDFHIFCAEFCGTSHSGMKSKVRVVDYEEYEKWVAAKSDVSAGLTPEEFGGLLYVKKGCNACHSLDGTRLVGPSWKGIFGAERKLASGATKTVDENYIRVSIEEPAVDVVESFAPVMPPYKGVLNDKEISGLIAYIKSLK